MCVACRGRAEKADLVRVVFAAGEYVVDAAQRLPGRGGYLHPACLGSVRGRRALPRAVRAGAGSPRQLDAVLDAALEEVPDATGPGGPA